MTATNYTRLASIEESEYGVTPGTGDFKTVRWTSESLSGTPETTESAEARTDRQSAGMTQVGLTVGGEIGFEISAAEIFKDYTRSAMKSAAWQSSVETTADTLSIVASTGVISGVAVDFVTAGIAVGDLVKLTGFTNTKNNGKLVYVTAVTATELTVIGNGLVDETGDGDETVLRPERIEIGTDDVSFTIEKNFTALTNRTIVYRGAMAESLSLGFSYGEIASGSVNMVANDYETPATPITQSRTIQAASQERALNASSDVGLVVLDGAKANFAIQSLSIELSNNHEPDTNLGKLAPESYSAYTAAVNVSMSAYLRDGNWDYMQKKLDLTPVEICYYAQNADGGIAVHVPEAQLSFSDPAAGGKDQKVTMELSGQAKAPTNFPSALRIYWLPAASV